jgi:hypothetical protein
MVPEEGVEPTHPCGYWILSPARLPVPPLRVWLFYLFVDGARNPALCGLRLRFFLKPAVLNIQILLQEGFLAVGSVLNSVDQLIDGVYFVDVGAGATLSRHSDELRVFVSGQDNDRDGRQLGMDAAGGLEAGHFRHYDIQDDYIWLQLPDQSERTGAIWGFADNLQIRMVIYDFADHSDDGWVIVGNYDAKRGRNFFGGGHY